MKNKPNKAFTLIELLIAITIFFLISVMSYAPYNFYQKKVAIKNTGKQIAQTILRAKNMAVNGLINNDENQKIGLYITTNNNEKAVLNIISYPHSLRSSLIKQPDMSSANIIESFALHPKIQIHSLADQSNLLFLFDAISGVSHYYSWKGIVKENFALENGENTLDSVIVRYRYGNSSSPGLQGKIEYITETNIINY